MSPGNNQFLFQHLIARHPALACLREAPDLCTLNALAREAALPVRFCATPAQDALDYERRICELGRVYTRIHTWHDRLNAAMWLLWPQTKLAISRAHLRAAEPGPRNRRRDTLTLLDEVGVILTVPPGTSFEPLHRAHDWVSLFWERRQAWFSQINPLLLGHGLAEQCLAPYIGLTGKALYLEVQDGTDADARMARRVSDSTRLLSPRELLPLPVLGIPGWHPLTCSRSFYRNTRYFRPRRPTLS